MSMRKIKPLNDFIFKKLFGEKENEDVRYMGVKTTGIVKTTYFSIN